MGMFSRKKTNDAPRRRLTQSSRAGDARREAMERRDSEGETDQTLFRRNRTLTGSLSSQVGSANERQADLKSPRIHAHDLAHQRKKLSSILGGIITVSVVLAGILYQFTARPIATSADGSIAIDAARYEQELEKYLQRHPVERLRFVMNADRLNEYISTQLPEVVSVDVGGFGGFGASTFDIAVRKPLVSWMIGSTQYFVDANGVPFEKNYYETPAVRIIDQSGAPQTSGTAIASTRFLNFVGRTVSLTSDQGLTVEQAVIPQGTTRQIELRIEGHDYPIKLSLDRPVGEQVEDMKNTIEYFSSKNIVPEYADIRVSGKAFYKAK